MCKLYTSMSLKSLNIVYKPYEFTVTRLCLWNWFPKSQQNHQINTKCIEDRRYLIYTFVNRRYLYEWCFIHNNIACAFLYLKFVFFFWFSAQMDSAFVCDNSALTFKSRPDILKQFFFCCCLLNIWTFIFIFLHSAFIFWIELLV